MNRSYKNILFVLFLILNLSPLRGQIRLSPWVGFGSQSINYTYSGASIEGASGVNFGVDGFFSLNENMAIGAGFRMGSYEASATFAAFSLEQSQVDMDGDSHLLTTKSDGIEESHKLATIEIPILFRYEKWVTNNLLLYGASGPVFVLPGTIKSEFISGNLATSGFYPEWNLTIDELDEYGFYNQTLSGEMAVPEAKTSVAWDIEVGGELFVAKRVNLMVSLYYQTGLSSVTESAGGNVASDPFAFNGSLMGASDAKLSKMGIKIGVNFDLTPKEKGSIKSIR